MGSTTKTVDMTMSIIQNSTAATTVSRYEYSKVTTSQTSVSFDGFLNKASNTMSVAKVNADRNNRLQDIAQKLQKTDTNKIQNTNAKDDVSKKQADKSTVETNKPVKDTNNTDKANVNTDTKSSRQETDSKEANTKLQDAINEDGKEIAAEIAKALDVSEEEIVNAMEILGLMFGDLLNPQNIQNLVTQLGGQDKALDLITDPDLNTLMQDLYEGADSMKSELMNEFDLSEEELDTAIEEARPEFIVNKEEHNDPLNMVKEDLSKDLKAPQSKDLTTEVKVEVISESETETEFKPVENAGEASKENSKNNGENLSENAQNTTLFNQLLDKITEAADAKAADAPQYTNRAQMENIIRQITDKITITAAEHETSMELQLHPASLGNVNVLLTSSKDGIVAKFTAQNEIVKEAVESQMQVLQQKFNEQGIKVTSIEITIASHAFEQNLQQEDQNQAFDEQQQKKKTLRRINLGEELSLEEEENLSDEDRLAAEVLAMNGSSVDFSA